MKAHLSILRIAHWRASLASLPTAWVVERPSLRRILRIVFDVERNPRDDHRRAL